MSNDHLVTPEYRKQLEEKHKTGIQKYFQKKGKWHELPLDGHSWGGEATKEINRILKLIDDNKVTEILDYGSGSGNFRNTIAKYDDYSHIKVHEYEPGRPELANNNHPKQALICVDVLEHIEPDCFHAVMKDIQRCMLECGLLVPCTTPALQILPDGRNAHLIVKPTEWWTRVIRKYFTIYEYIPRGNSPAFFVRPLDGMHKK